MPSYTAGTAYLQIAPSLRGLHREIEREIRSITPEPTIKVRIEPVWRRGTPIPPPPIGDQEVRVPVRAVVDKKSFADSTQVIAQLQRNLVTLAKPVAVAFAVPAVVGFGVAVRDVAKITSLLPAVVASAGVAVAAYKVGVSGLADAFKAVKDGDPEKIAEAMANLSPSARTLVTEVMRISPAFKSMRLEVQEQLFKGVGVAVSDLAMRYLPTLRTGLGGVAGELRQFALQTIAAANGGRQIDSVAKIFNLTRESVNQLNGAGGALVQIFLDMAVVGGEFLPSMAKEFGLAAERARLFIANARDTGQLKIWIQEGVTAVRDLWKILINVGVTINNVLNAAGLDNFLGGLVKITEQTRAWSESADGVKAVADLFGSLTDLGVSLAPALAKVGQTIISVITAVGPAIKPLAQGVTDVVAAAGPVVELFTALGVSVLPPLGAALSFLAPVLGPIVAAFLAAGVAAKVWAGATVLLGLVQKGFAVTMAIVNGAVMAYNLVAAIIRGNINLWATAQFLLNAAMAANPIGVVVVVIGLLIAAIVLAWHHSETFRNVVMGAWEGIKTAAAATWAWLQTMFASFMTALTDVGNFFTMLWTQYVVPAWEGIKVAFVAGGAIIASVWDGIVFAAKFAFVLLATIIITPLMLLWNELAGLFMFGYENFIKPAWEGISSAATAAWAILQPIFAFIVDWVGTQLTTTFTGFQAVVQVVWTAIQTAINVAWTFIRDMIFLPIQIFVDTILTPLFQRFQSDTTASWEGIRAGIDAAWVYIRDNIWTPIVDFLNVTLGPVIEFHKVGIIAAWEMIRAGIDAAWVFIRDQIWNPMVEFITVTIPNGFQTGVDAIGRLWDGVKKALRDPLQAAIDVVWNNGIVKVWNMVADLVGLGTKLSPYSLPGFAEGGPITGGKPNKDSVLIRAMPGEFMFSKSAVDSMGGTNAVAALHAMFKAGGSPRAAGGANKFLPGYAGGGPIAPAPAGPSANPFALIGDIWGALTGAISAVRNVASGAGQWGAAVGGFGVKIGEAVLTSLQQKVASWLAQFVGIGGPGGGGGLGGGSQAAGTGQVGTMMAALRRAFPGLGLISGVRPGAITATGNRSYHASGRAVDVPPSMAVFNWIKQNYPNSREIIFSPAGGAQVHNGSPHMYTGVTRSMHYDHVHWAYDRGGMAKGSGFMRKDSIRPERVLSNRQTRAFEALVAHQTGQGYGSRVQADPGGATPGQPMGSGSFIGQLVVSPQPGDTIQDVLDTAMTRARHEFHSGRYGRR